MIDRLRKIVGAVIKRVSYCARGPVPSVLPSSDAAGEVEELKALSERGKGHAKGWRFDREELHERS